MSKVIRTGSVYQRTYRDQKTNELKKTTVYYLKYYVNGKPVYISSGTENYDEALAMLLRRQAEVCTAKENYSTEPDRVRMNQLFDLLIENYEFQKRKSLYDTKGRIDKHLRPFFGERKAQGISTKVIREYVSRRLRQEAEPATINKELAFVRHAMHLGQREEPKLVVSVPYFEMLPTDNVRMGTLGHEQYRAVRDGLPKYARIALVIAYHTGARKGEIRAIRREQIDLKAGRILLPGRTTKNGEPRYLPIYGDMAAEIDMALSAGKSSCPFLVQDNGNTVFDFEKAWATACEKAGVPDALFHDLRRTALTNMINAGFSEKEAMAISGHKTRYVFDRYHIVSERKMRENAEKLAAYLKTMDAEAVATEAQRQGRAVTVRGDSEKRMVN